MSDINARYNNVTTVTATDTRPNTPSFQMEVSSPSFAKPPTNLQSTDSFKKKINICDNFDARWDLCLKMPKFKQYSIFYNNVFIKILTLYRATPKLEYDFLDEYLNSPLHIASQNGYSDCIKVLLTEYNLKADIRNIDGWMAKDMVQNDYVKEVYKLHYKKIERERIKAVG